MQWVGGFEGADHVNGRGQALCMAAQSGHLARLDGDYRRLRRLGFSEVRESLGWRVCAHSAGFDLGSLHARMRAAARQGLRIRWTLMHYGVPAGLDLLDGDDAVFVAHFAAFCTAVARALAAYPSAQPRLFTPINELSFLCWAATCTGLFHPHVGDRGDEGPRLKARLVRAALAGCRAIRAVDPDARMLWVEPLVHVAVPAGRADLRAQALQERAAQFEVLDMLSGRTHPWLGGAPACVDLVGLNYYHGNQWEAGSRRTLEWHRGDPLRWPLSRLLRQVHERYRLPMTISETSHVGEGRATWLQDVAHQVRLAADDGAAIEGVCLYPVMDRPDWEEPTRWHASGLWQVDPRCPAAPPTLIRDYALALAAARCTLHAPPLSSYGTPTMRQLLVFSHLRWDFVYQRPQHLLSRFGQRWDVVVFEEPVHDRDRAAWLEVLHPCIGVTVLRAHTPIAEPGFADAQFPLLSGLLRDWLATHGEPGLAVWLYTPMALPLVQGLAPGAILYDCMDELGAFKNAPERLMDREKTLLDVADRVFTGGPSLQDAKAPRNPQVHCFPSSVDVAHFAQGRREPAAAARVPATPPRLGFFGVLDERLDLALLGALARAHPDWEIDLVGPVVKIDPATLPQAPNLHYLGQRDYADLPAHIAGWDVCLLPFAMNASTAFISPTKTLEYMAAHKPVVSAPVRDVVRLYAAGVQIADGPAAFIGACERALAESEPARRQRIREQDALTAATSWDRTADAMAELVQQSVAAGLNPRAQAYLDGAHVVALEDAPVECLILGAGPTGLSAAYHYGAGSVLVEREQTVGGWCRSLDDQGFRFDYAGHIMFSNDPDVLALYDTLLGDNLHWQNREAWVYSKGVHTRYPFQGALYGLPPAVLKECLVGAIEARFGALDGSPAPAVARATPAPVRDAAARAANDAGDCCADGAVLPACAGGDPKDLAASATVTAFARRGAPANFEEFIHQVWGAGVAKHFAVPYNTKLWTVPLREMETSWLGGRVPMPNLDEMIEGALQPVASPVGPNARFGYPLRGGFQALMDGFLPHLQGTLALGRTATAISVRRRQVSFADGQRLRWQQLVSTLPLPEFVRLLGDEAPERIRTAAAGLRHVSVRCVNLGVGRADLTDKHWIYYPEQTIFHRIFVQGNASPHNNPPGGFGLTCEITYSPTKPLPVDGDALIDRCIAECIEVGMLRADDPILTASIVDMPYAYVLYDHARAANVETIRSWLLTHGIFLAGRYSEWEYYNSDHAFLAGRRAAGQVRAALTRREARST